MQLTQPAPACTLLDCDAAHNHPCKVSHACLLLHGVTWASLTSALLLLHAPQHYKRLPVGQVVAGQTAALALKKIKRAQVGDTAPHPAAGHRRLLRARPCLLYRLAPQFFAAADVGARLCACVP